MKGNLGGSWPTLINASLLITLTEIASYHWHCAVAFLKEIGTTPRGSRLLHELCMCVLVYKLSAQLCLTHESVIE